MSNDKSHPVYSSYATAQVYMYLLFSGWGSSIAFDFSARSKDFLFNALNTVAYQLTKVLQCSVR